MMPPLARAGQPLFQPTQSEIAILRQPKSCASVLVHKPSATTSSATPNGERFARSAAAAEKRWADRGILNGPPRLSLRVRRCPPRGLARLGRPAACWYQFHLDLIVVPFRDHRRPAEMRDHHARVLRPARPSTSWCHAAALKQYSEQEHHAGLLGQQQDGGISPATGSCTAPRSRWWMCLTSWPSAGPAAIRLRMFHGRVAPWARRRLATRPSWRNPGTVADRSSPPNRARYRLKYANPEIGRRNWNTGGRHPGSHLAASHGKSPPRPSCRPPPNCPKAAWQPTASWSMKRPAFTEYFFDSTPIPECRTQHRITARLAQGIAKDRDLRAILGASAGANAGSPCPAGMVLVRQ